MNKKQVVITIIGIIVFGSCIYYWQNSKTALKAPILKEQVFAVNEVQKLSNQVVDKNVSKTLNWNTYSNMGVSIKYPNDGTYVVDEEALSSDLNGFTISQDYPGNRIHIYKVNDLSTLPVTTKTKVIAGKTYKILNRDGMGFGYGYIIKQDEQLYVFESTKGPKNEIFELMMTTIKFE